jgi:hypothetical protein
MRSRLCQPTGLIIVTFIVLLAGPVTAQSPSPSPPTPAPSVSPVPSPSPRADPRPRAERGDRLHRNLAEMATDPISQLGRVKLENFYTPSYLGGPGTGNKFKIFGAIPIGKTQDLPVDQLLRVEIPVTWPRGLSTSVGDMQAFDLFSMDFAGGMVGFGPTMVFPTANSHSAGGGKWQAGPALGFMYTKLSSLQLGFLAQNPISFAGDPHRTSVNELLLQPLLTCHLGEGWYVNSDATMTFNWLKTANSIPVSLGVGRVFRFGSQHVNVNAEYEWSVHHQGMTVPNNTIVLKFELLYP